MFAYLFILGACIFAIYLFGEFVSWLMVKKEKQELVNLWSDLRKKELVKMGKIIFPLLFLASCSIPDDERYWVTPYSRNGIEIVIIFDKKINEFCIEESGRNFKYEELGKQCGWGK
jgi:hypothetical protein